MEIPDIEDLSDDALIAQYRAGAEEALSILFERYLGQIYRFAYRMTHSSEDASDIAQETFVKVWRTLSRYKTGQSFKAWIFAIAHNTSIDRLRKKQALPFSKFETADGTNILEETLADDTPLPPALFERAEQEGLLEKALETLEPSDREILLLHYDEEMTFEEIGRTLKKSTNTVKSRSRRALQKLRIHLNEWTDT